MKIFLVGKRDSITHWFEDTTAAFEADGHDVRLGVVRHPWLNARLEAALAEPLASAMAARAARFDPEMVLIIGGLHAPPRFVERLAALPGRPPLVGWVGDTFDANVRQAADLYDLLAYTDSGLVARHAELGFRPPNLFLPHAANPRKAPPERHRAPRMVFVATPTPGRRAVVDAVVSPLAIFGPGWVSGGESQHDIHSGRVAAREVAGLYAGHLAALNVRNERNVVSGLNQRSFDPCLSATPVVTDDQADVELCFDPGQEVLVWRDIDSLNDTYERLLRDPADAARIGAAGRRRVLTDHTFARRLETLRAAL